MSVVTRFAPSPTGYLHVGGARTALYSWLYAKSQGGEFVLRIEDTDIERSTEQAKQAILEGMQWLGLSHDKGPYYQTERFDKYNQYVDQLLEQGHAVTVVDLLKYDKGSLNHLYFNKILRYAQSSNPGWT